MKYKSDKKVRRIFKHSFTCPVEKKKRFCRKSGVNERGRQRWMCSKCEATTVYPTKLERATRAGDN